MTIEMIAAMTSNRAIGKDNKLLIHDSEDLRHFKKMTMGKFLVVGRKTAELLPNLSDRQLIILSSQSIVQTRQLLPWFVYSDVYAMLDHFNNAKLIVIGGESVYNRMILFADMIHLTVFDIEMEGDKYFPEIDMNEFAEIRRRVYNDKSIITYKRR